MRITNFTLVRLIKMSSDTTKIVSYLKKENVANYLILYY